METVPCAVPCRVGEFVNSIRARLRYPDIGVYFIRDRY